MTEPHPLRCKTCINDCRYKRFVDEKDEMINYNSVHDPSSDIFYFVKKHGCASHSNAKTGVFAIFHEDGSMDDGEQIMLDEVYSTFEVAQARRDLLYEKDVAERRIDFAHDTGHLQPTLEKEIKHGCFGNLNPLYKVITLIVKNRSNCNDSRN